MNPNSVHQLWSKWTVIVRNGRQPSQVDVATNTARFVSKHYGHAGSCRVRQFPKAWVIEVLIESSYHPLDRTSFNAVALAFTQFYKNGFGPTANIIVKSKLMAGPRFDGSPPDQLIVMPHIIDQELYERSRHGQRPL